MKKIDHLLACLGEECGELQQIVGKSLRFGLLSSNPSDDTKSYNWVELRKELHDIVAVYEMLCDEFDRVEDIDRDLLNKKKLKVERYFGIREFVQK